MIKYLVQQYSKKTLFLSEKYPQLASQPQIMTINYYNAPKDKFYESLYKKAECKTKAFGSTSKTSSNNYRNILMKPLKNK